jgi:hypothetical protein
MLNPSDRKKGQPVLVKSKGMKEKGTPALTSIEKESLADLLASLPASTESAADAAQALGRALSLETAAARRLLDEILLEGLIILQTATPTEIAVNRVERPEGPSSPLSRWFRTEKRGDGDNSAALTS